MAIRAQAGVATSDSDGKNVLSQQRRGDRVGHARPGSRGNRKRGYVKTVYRNAKGTVTTLAVVLPDVPAAWSVTARKFDASGRVVRRSTLKLLDYGIHPENDRPGLLRKHSGRRGKVSLR